jgi:hypothetical protein
MHANTSTPSKRETILAAAGLAFGIGNSGCITTLKF